MRATRREPRSGQQLRRQYVAWPGNALLTELEAEVADPDNVAVGRAGPGELLVHSHAIEPVADVRRRLVSS